MNTQLASEITVRPMTAADVVHADKLRQIAGWNQTIDGWHDLLELHAAGCLVAEAHGAVVGTVTSTPFATDLAWIGMMLVHPDHRNRGIASTLMRTALSHLQRIGVRLIGLDATPAGLPVYQKLGFVEVSQLSRWHRPADTRSNAETAIAAPIPWRNLEAADWEEIGRMDQASRGALRLELLRVLNNRSVAALVACDRDRLAGWGLLKPGVHAMHIGPIQGSPAACATLFGQLVQRAGRRAVFCDIPEANGLAVGAAVAAGFQKLRPLTRMLFHSASSTNIGKLEFCIADPSTS